MITDYLKCPLTKLYFNDPVLASNGMIYERMAIEHCIRNRSLILQNNILLPVNLIKNMVNVLDEKYQIDRFMNKKPYFLFKNELIDDIKKHNFENILNYTDIECVHIFENNITIGNKIISSCKNDNLVINIINKFIDIDVFDDNGDKLIHIISIYSNQNIFQYLLNKHVNIKEKSKIGDYPLHNVVKYYDKIDTLMHIFTYDNIIYVNDKGMNVGHVLCKNIKKNADNSKIRLVKKIISDNKLNNIFSDEGKTCLHYLCRYTDNSELLEDIFNMNIDLKIKTTNDKDVHDLLYFNKLLSNEDKQKIIRLYLNITNRVNVQIIKNFI